MAQAALQLAVGYARERSSMGKPIIDHQAVGFRLAEEYGIMPRHPEWAEHFQVRTLTAYDPAVRGEFAYPEPFERL